MMFLRCLLFGALCFLTGLPVHADMLVETAADKVVVRVTAPRLAAWKTAPDELVIMADGEGDVDIKDMPVKWQGDILDQAGMHGVRLHGTAGSWAVLQEGDHWLVREGTPQQKAAHAMMLKDGWRVNGQPVPRRQVMVGDAVWQVGPVSEPVSVAGSVVGMVRKGAATREEIAAEASQSGKAAETAVPAVTLKSEEANLTTMPVREPVSSRQAASGGKGASPTMVMKVLKLPQALIGKADHDASLKPVSISQMLSRLEPAAGDTRSSQQPLASPHGVMAAAAVGGGEASVVPETATESLAAMPSPAPTSETLLRVISAAAVKGVYVPGTVVSITVPAELKRQGEVSSTTPPMAENERLRDDTAELVEGLFPAAEGNYTEVLSEAMQALVEVDEGSAAERQSRRQMAAFYLAWNRPEEAELMTLMLPKRADGLPADATARLYWGLAQLAMDRKVPDAAFDQKGPLAKHAALWRAVAASRAEDYGKALQIWPKERGVLPEYPSYLRQLAQIAQASALVTVADKDVARKVVDELVGGYPEGKVPAGLLRLQGIARLGTKDEQKGMDLLAKAAESKDDLAEAFRAKFQFVQVLRQHNEISDAQAQKYMEELWSDWRGDNLERAVLTALADLYEKNGKPREALERWRTLIRAFPDTPDINVVTARMTQSFVDVFDPENPQTYDPLTYLGLYYDFRELLPNDERGDRVQEQIGRMLADSTLWKRAEPILEQQLNYRPLDQASQARTVLMLAEVYRRGGKAADSLKLLDKWKKVAVGNNNPDNWKMATARALIDLGRYESAKKTLTGMKDLESLRLMAEADWKQKNWSGAIATLQQQLVPVPVADVVNDTSAQLALFQMAYAYGQLKDAQGLKAMKERYAAALAKSPKLADGINAVAASAGMSEAEGGGVLAPLTSALAGLNDLTDKVAQLKRKDELIREERRQYNDKMRYMELLPPPVI